MKHALLSFIFILFSCGLSAQSMSHRGQAEDLRVFPNPVVEYFKIGHSDRVKTLSLMNMTGRTVKRFKYSDNRQYDIATLHRGVYLLQMRDSSNKVIKTLRITKR